MQWVRAARAVSAAVAVAILSAGIKTIPEHPAVGWTMCGVAALFGVVVAVLWITSDSRFRRVRNGLGELLRRADGLSERNLTNDAEFTAWKADLDAWHRDAVLFLRSNLSEAHVAIFQNQPLSPKYNIPGLHGDHRGYLHSLDAYSVNLRAILERYLSVRD